MQHMKRWSFLNSLARRIQLGYCLLLLVALIMLLVALGLANIRQRVAALETVSALSDTVLEIRRYEKNWLLYRQAQDFHENQAQIGKALTLLHEKHDPQSSSQAELECELLRYREVINKDFSFFQVAQRGQTLS